MQDGNSIRINSRPGHHQPDDVAASRVFITVVGAKFVNRAAVVEVIMTASGR